MAEILLDQTNPVYNTAKLTLSILGRAGVPEAVDYAERLGFTDIRKSFDVNEDNGSELPQTILQETRYEFLNRVIRESGCKNIVDIACGFSPRGYIMAKEGYNYRGIDLEASVQALSGIADELKKDNLPGALSYVACDLTDPDAFEKALEDIEGEVLVVCEGLLMYLKPFEGRSLFQGLYRVLTSHGGCFVSPDFEMGPIYIGVHTALLGREEGMKALMAMANTTSGKSDSKWGEGISSAKSNPEKVLAEENLAVEKIAYYTEAESCHALSMMKEEDSQRVKATLLTLKGWSISAVEQENTLDGKKDKEKYSGAYKTEYKTDGEKLCLTVCGRVDSITSNDLLEKYNTARATAQFKSIEIDCTDLVYISSAGLRVLMIMKKDIGDNSITLMNVSAEVFEILGTTGFDSVVTIV